MPLDIEEWAIPAGLSLGCMASSLNSPVNYRRVVAIAHLLPHDTLGAYRGAHESEGKFTILLSLKHAWRRVRTFGGRARGTQAVLTTVPFI